MTTLREAAQQALEALLTPSGAQACSTCQNGPENEYCCRMEMWSAITALRTALAQQDAPLNLRDPAVQKRLATQWGYAPAAQAEPDLSRCPRCNGPADNGFDRSIPPSPYLCTKCMAEPVEPVEPVAEVFVRRDGVSFAFWLKAPPPERTKLYTAPPQRLPLTEEEILKAIGWERAEMYMKLATNFPVDEAKQETLKNARAVERAVWEKNHG